MTRKRLTLTVTGIAVVTALVIAAALGVFTHGQTATATHASTDGVKVHGQWTILVRDKSGKIVSRHNFHNEFLSLGDIATSGPECGQCGDNAISTILSGQMVAGDWSITIFGNACSGGFTQCRLYEPDEDVSALAGGITRTNNLTVTVPTTGPDTWKIVLHGTVSPPSDGTITGVETTVQACSSGSTPGADCGGSDVNTRPFTDRTLAPAVDVLAGQSVDVTVKLSFA